MFLAVDEVALVAVSIRVVEDASPVPLAVLELAPVPAPRERAEGARAVHAAVRRAVAGVLIRVSAEGAEPLVGAPARVAFQLCELPKLDLELRDVAVDAEAGGEVHVAADARAHEAVLDALHHEAGPAASQAKAFQQGRGVRGMAAEALKDLQDSFYLGQAAHGEARAVDVAAAAEVVLGEVLGEALRGLAPEAEGPLHAPLHLLGSLAHAARKA
mmetsp:Transcript_115201/g.279532  ORF Transcript_115201/g.279532 Transcript_115201/m.279532 type:complete len:215 (-) Transcript_115201:241-885(-)